jgi:hypothetical protein
LLEDQGQPQLCVDVSSLLIRFVGVRVDKKYDEKSLFAEKMS